MHNNYYFLKQLTRPLQSRLEGAVVSECFSQHKDELVIRFETTRLPFFIKASLHPAFSCLSFPPTYNRARRNSVDLFAPLIGRRVERIRQFINERSFAMEFNDHWLLLFKLHGNRSNLVLLKEKSVHELFKKNLRGDATLDPDTLDRTIDWRYEHFMANQQTLKKVYFTFGKVPWRYLEENDFNAKPPAARWEALQALLGQLERNQYFITVVDDVPVLSLVPVGRIQQTFTDPVQAVNAFFPFYAQSEAFRNEKRTALHTLHTRLSGCNAYLQEVSDNLENTQQHNAYKIWADVLMANLHAIPAGAGTVELPNFYNDNKPLLIKLKKDLNAQKNAAIFYRKAKNQAIEIEFLQKTRQAKEAEAEGLRAALASVEQAPDLTTLREATRSLQLEGKTGKRAVSLPYHEFEHKGYIIRVGKNAAANDELTLKHAYKEDLWLHAKDVAGSHVIIKHQAGKKIPADVVERAAQLAAYNSKRKNESLCPVIVTPKKFVRKRKGDPPGAVVVEREEVIMVEPRMD